MYSRPGQSGNFKSSLLIWANTLTWKHPVYTCTSDSCDFPNFVSPIFNSYFVRLSPGCAARFGLYRASTKHDASYMLPRGGGDMEEWRNVLGKNSWVKKTSKQRNTSEKCFYLIAFIYGDENISSMASVMWVILTISGVLFWLANSQISVALLQISRQRLASPDSAATWK